jgi:hypothetical protein
LLNNNETNQYLGQNIPNPFKNTTTLPYYLPFGSEGYMEISDISGKGLMKYPLQQGKNKLDISFPLFNSGTYLYSIRIDGKVKETKKMILE